MATNDNTGFGRETDIERKLHEQADFSAGGSPAAAPASAAPSAAKAADAVPTCPHCSRKLLSVRSILCNWCGKRIEDSDYLERAAGQRAAEDARMRDQVEKELEETAKMGILGRLTGKRKAAAQRREPNVLIPPSDL